MGRESKEEKPMRETGTRSRTEEKGPGNSYLQLKCLVLISCYNLKGELREMLTINPVKSVGHYLTAHVGSGT